MKRALRFICIAGMAVSSANAANAAEEAGRLPVDWYVAPEDQPSYQKPTNEVDNEEYKENAVYRRSEDAVGRSIDKIFEASTDALAKSRDLLGSSTRPENAPANWVPWHLKNIIMDLGIAGAGTVGIVTATGEVTAEIQWRRTAAKMKALGLDASVEQDEERKADVVIDETASATDVETLLQPVVKAVMATGRVNNESRMREELFKVARELQDLMVDINKYNGYATWDVGRLQLDVSIAASGMVQPGVTVGGDVRLSFEWKKAATTGKPDIIPDPENEDARENLRKLLTATAEDLEQISASSYEGSGFELNGFRLGVGMYAKAKFGIVKGRLGAIGYVHFERSKGKSAYQLQNRGNVVLPDESPVIDTNATPEHLTYARMQGVSYETIPDGEGGAAKVVYYMVRKRFQQGLDRATQMGAFFAKRASNQTSNSWEIFRIRPQFSLSLEGALPMVTVGGQVALRIHFEKI